jgi:uncharacterized protein YqjF (DUF2071 family)
MAWGNCLQRRFLTGRRARPPCADRPGGAGDRFWQHVAMTGREPDSDLRVPLLRQAWLTVTFVHWRYDPSVLQAVLPPGLTVDERDGAAWVSMIPLRMRDVRLAGAPAVPGLSAFPETNLRTYVRGPDGRQGVWFYSLDAASTWITVGARLLLGAPYYRSRLKIASGSAIRYSGTRPGRRPAGYQLDAQAGSDIQPGDLDLWLTHRWRAYTRYAGLLLEVPVRHEPWPLRSVTVGTLEESLTAAAGLPAPAAPALAHYSDGVTGVAFGVVRPLRQAERPARSAAC